MIVVDANVVVYLLTPGTQSELAWAAVERDDDWRVPVLWRSEVRNALLGFVRRAQVGESDAVIAMGHAERLLEDAEHDVDSARVLAIAIASGCSAYDCEYVSLAEALDVRVVTSDQEVLVAFRDRAVSLEDFAAGR